MVGMDASAPRPIDLNADLGEEVTDDDALLRLVTSANVACGYHAGGPDIMRRVCEGAAERGVRVGAQVSYDDREGFGRRRRDVAADVLAGQVADQVGLLEEIATAAGTRVRYVKPHGALYNRVVDDAEQAAAVLAGSGDLPVLGLPGSAVLAQARASGREAVPEGFPDRGYLPVDPAAPHRHRLRPRGEPGAVLTDPDDIADRAVRLAEAGEVRSLCVHGDGETAVAAATSVARALREAGFVLVAFR